jgi:hypothetical protein
MGSELVSVSGYRSASVSACRSVLVLACQLAWV